eukprot:22050-Eustigmatos_ZCMA.PRE.1
MTARGHGKNKPRYTYLVPPLGVLGELTREQRQDYLELGIVGRVGIGQGPVLRVPLLRLEALMDQERHVTTIINNQIRPIALSVITRPRDRAQRALP